MSRDPALETYVIESQDLLEQMEQGLLAFTQGRVDAETINAVFRAAHTIKGSAGLFGLDEIVAFTHTVESVLDRVREGQTAMDAALAALLLRCRDHMSRLVEAVAASRAMSGPDLAAGAELSRLLGAYLKGAAVEQHAQGAAKVHGVDDANTTQSGLWQVTVRFGPDVFRNGMDPLSFVRYLESLGELAGVAVQAPQLPTADELDAESCHLEFEIALRASTTRATIQSAFEFVREDCALSIVEPGAAAAGASATTVSATQTASSSPAAAPGPASAAPSVSASASTTNASTTNAASPGPSTKSPESRFIRLDAEKLDTLINLVGELVIAGAGIAMASKRIGDRDLAETASTLTSLVEEVRDRALQLRMVQIGATFNRFQRVVHDVAAELGKDIALAVSGAETELDKTMVERIGDPLTHLVRNAMDHGIEPADVRAARGKPARGLVRLNAYHDAGSVVIEVADDGGGLNRERILAKARERGLIGAEQVLTDAEVWNIIFEPGFSTASTISNLSGRGVGMDVVKRSITSLRGSVEVQSQAQVGTTVRIRLPLTLAIIDGFNVGVGASVFVVPLDMVEECMELTAAAREESRGRDFINLRGKVLPLIVARELFAIEAAPVRRENILVLRYGGQRAGLVVDELMGEAQTVIKPLGSLFRNVTGICGSTVLGDGRVGLILDVPGLLTMAHQVSDRRHAMEATA